MLPLSESSHFLQVNRFKRTFSCAYEHNVMYKSCGYTLLLKLWRTEFVQLLLQTEGWRIWQALLATCICKDLFLLLIRSALLGEVWLGGFLPPSTVPGGTARHGWQQFPSVLPRHPMGELGPCSEHHGGVQHYMVSTEPLSFLGCLIHRLEA